MKTRITPVFEGVILLFAEVNRVNKWLSPREAAEILGINSDTLRRWERDGRIESERTPGGQRRYCEQDVLTLLKGETPTRKNAPPERSRFPSIVPTRDHTETEHVRVPEMPTWERRVKEEAADVEVIKLRREKAALIRAEREERDEREKREAFRKQEFTRRNAESEQRAKADAADRQRLADLRVYGNGLGIAAPPEYQAKVARDLLSSVNAEDYPADLNLYLAHVQVEARVSELLKPWRESQAREREREEEQRKLNSLIHSGLSYARVETWEWEREDAARVIREVEQALLEDAEADWSIDDVRDAVDEILDDLEC